MAIFLDHRSEILSLSESAERLKGRLLLLLLSLAWGLNWPMTRIALDEIRPWTLRMIGLPVAALVLFTLAKLTRRRIRIPAGRPRVHTVLSGLLSVAAFNIFSAFAQLASTTSRVIIVVYTMPIWASLLAWPLLGERLTARRVSALFLCGGGLAILIYPLVRSELPIGIVLAWGSALSWAGATIYLKWAKIEADFMAVAAWQFLVGSIAVAIGFLLVGEPLPSWPLHPQTLLALIYNVLIGMALAYYLWLAIIARLSAATASLGALLVPVVGIASSAVMLGDRPTGADIVGFALVFAAAAFVLLPERRRPEIDAAQPSAPKESGPPVRIRTRS